MSYVRLTPREEVVDAYHIVAHQHEAVDQM